MITQATNTKPAQPGVRRTTSLPPSAHVLDSAAPDSVAVATRGLSFRYGQRVALSELDLTISRGEIFAILGPNGGGKTTLFRLLSTLVPMQTGTATVLRFDLARERQSIRSQIGVVFQAPSVDRKLTVAENVDLQGRLYGLGGSSLRQRRDELLAQFGLSERVNELTERLSGGLRRRVEIAKGLVHSPELLLLDEPSTGLDPTARNDLWRYLTELRAAGTTIVFTTHFLDEAAVSDRLAILSEGKLVALGAPEELQASVGGDSITIETEDAANLAAAISQEFGLAARELEGTIRLEVPDGHRWIARLVEAFPGRIRAIRLGKPTLEDVFIARTGHRFAGERRDS
jgi:ABC-2 type transport system ATP-binding protein